MKFDNPSTQALVYGHAYTTQEYLGTPSVATLRDATTRNTKLLESTREELDRAIEAQKLEARARVEAVSFAISETKRLTDEKVTIETEGLKNLTVAQEERFTWQQKASKFLAEALELAKSKKELAQYVLKICLWIAGLLVGVGAVGAYFFQSPRFAAYCVGGAAVLVGLGWFFVQIPQWLIVTGFVCVVIAIPAVLIHGYLHGKKVGATDAQPPTTK